MNGHRHRAAVLLASLIAAWQLGPGSTCAAFAAKALAATGAQTSAEDDKTAIHRQLSNLSRAVAAGDAKMLASLWTEDCTYTDDDGNVFSGRQNLEKHFQSVFQSGGGFSVDVVPDEFRMLAKGVAMTEGQVSRRDSPDLDTRYAIVLVNQAGKWLISMATETPLPPKPIPSQLNELEWLIGDWSAENGGNSVNVKSQWAGSNKNFIISVYEIKKQNQPAERETQVIGWDPRSQAIVSWHFDSQGGFANGKWTKANDNKWMVTSTGVLPDGETSESLNIISPQDANDFSWQSVRRSVDGAPVPGTEPLTVRRVKASTN